MPDDLSNRIGWIYQLMVRPEISRRRSDSPPPLLCFCHRVLNFHLRLSLPISHYMLVLENDMSTKDKENALNPLHMLWSFWMEEIGTILKVLRLLFGDQGLHFM